MSAAEPGLSTARQSLARLNARIDALTNPQHKAWLSTYRDHWWGEVVNDVDAVMATMSRGPIRYSFDGHPFMDDGGTMAAVRTWADTKAMYEGVVALGVRMFGPFDNERVFFDEYGLSIRSIVSAVYPGVFLSNHKEPVDPADYFLLRWPGITTVRFDEHGKFMGEDIQNGAPIRIQKVDASAIERLVEGPLPIAT